MRHVTVKGVMSLPVSLRRAKNISHGCYLSGAVPEEIPVCPMPKLHI